MGAENGHVRVEADKGLREAFVGAMIDNNDAMAVGFVQGQGLQATPGGGGIPVMDGHHCK
jgi:hypothetical protein